MKDKVLWFSINIPYAGGSHNDFTPFIMINRGKYSFQRHTYKLTDRRIERLMKYFLWCSPELKYGFFTYSLRFNKWGTRK